VAMSSSRPPQREQVLVTAFPSASGESARLIAFTRPAAIRSPGIGGEHVLRKCLICGALGSEYESVLYHRATPACPGTIVVRRERV
jgi:hypothetical protein